jgi:hypothetical protein
MEDGMACSYYGIITSDTQHGRINKERKQRFQPPKKSRD